MRPMRCFLEDYQMRVRLVFNPHEYWTVESKRWYQLSWHLENSFHGDNSYERAHFFARALKQPQTEEIT
jgi:hypothetical protein